VELRPAVAGDELMIVGSVGKDLDYFNVGESALPLRVIEDVELTPFHSPSQSKDYLETTRLHEAMFVSRQDVELKRQAGYTRITDPFFCLRETIADLWKNVYKRPEVRSQFITRCLTQPQKIHGNNHCVPCSQFPVDAFLNGTSFPNFTFTFTQKGTYSSCNLELWLMALTSDLTLLGSK